MEDNKQINRSSKFELVRGLTLNKRMACLLFCASAIVPQAGFAQPANDNWSNSQMMLAFPVTMGGSNFNATTQPLEQNLTNPIVTSTVWWFFQAPSSGTVTIQTFGSNFNTVLHVYTDFQNGFGNFTLVAFNDQAGGGDQSQVTFQVNANQRYEVRVAGRLNAQGSIALSGFFEPPFNDNWNSSGSQLPFPFETTGHNFNASVQPMEQNLTNPIVSKTVWWNFVPSHSGIVSIDTFGSDFNTVLHVYTNAQNGFGNFTLVAFNDQAGGGNQSQVTFPVEAFQFYEIRVAGRIEAQGNIVLNGFFEPPFNDNWNSVGSQLTLPFETTGQNLGASVQPMEQNLTNPICGSTVWWFAEASDDGMVSIDTFGSDFDTVLHVYSDFQNVFGNFTLVASNDQAGGGDQSQVTFPVEAFKRYEIRVAGRLSAQGTIAMTGIFTPDGFLLGDVNLDGVVSLLDVQPFVTLLTGGGFQAEADINMDDEVSLLDVQPFVELLTGP